MQNQMNTGSDGKPARGRNRKGAAVGNGVLSWRTILGLAVGVILGAALGLGYYHAAPSISASARLWKSDMPIQVKYPDYGSYIDPRAIENTTQGYVLATQSLSFLESLRTKITADEPRYAYTVDELRKMMTLTYDTSTGGPITGYKVTVMAPSAEEATFILGRIPVVFNEYLAAAGEQQAAARDPEQFEVDRCHEGSPPGSAKALSYPGAGRRRRDH